MRYTERVFAIHDISGVGKCSLTAAIPIISSVGVECCPVPTAVLSTHTGEISGYTFRDLTEDIPGYIAHWKSLQIKPDTIYTGYLGSIKQIDYVSDIIDLFNDNSPFVIVDPAMADSGKLYKGFGEAFACAMVSLCEKADVIIPNLTEAALISETDFLSEYSESDIESLAKAVSEHCKRYVILTGIGFEKEFTGYYAYDKLTGKHRYRAMKKYDGLYYGTGDIFASVIAGCISKGIDLFDACDIALKFTNLSVGETYRQGTDTRFGVAFEKYIPELIKLTGGISQ